jgi:hypothetical protein
MHNTIVALVRAQKQLFKKTSFVTLLSKLRPNVDHKMFSRLDRLGGVRADVSVAIYPRLQCAARVDVAVVAASARTARGDDCVELCAVAILLDYY